MDTEAITIENRRFRPEDSGPLGDIAARFAKAYGYTAQDLGVDPGLAQLLRLRVSQINNCTYCMNLHYEAAREVGVPRVKVDTLSAWWETGLFSPAEQAALEYTEALTRIADTTVAASFAAHHERAAEHFSGDQIVAIAGIVINMNVWTRLKLAQGATPTLEG